MLSLFLCMSCKSENTTPVTPQENHTTQSTRLSKNRPDLNVSILLDLSDRINPKKYPNPTMEYYQRDLGYINSIATGFEIHLRNKRSVKINDHIQLYIDPEPADKNLNSKIQLLDMGFNRDNAKKEMILAISKTYDSLVNGIYEAAIVDDKYVGSDIWRFFKTKVKDLCIEKDHRNLLVILTDGYIYHEDTKLHEENKTSFLTPQLIRNFSLNDSKWETKFKEKNYGFLPATQNLKNLEVLVLGIHPDTKNPYEEDVIIAYWSSWFKAMGIEKFEIKGAYLPADMDEIISDFVLKE